MTFDDSLNFKEFTLVMELTLKFFILLLTLEFSVVLYQFVHESLL